MHAAPRGAGLLVVLAREPGQNPPKAAKLAVACHLAATGHLFDAQEDDRLAYALPSGRAGRDRCPP
ncbi:hypothetical protein GR925_31280 [Streptomyces sp. HUCO-GS316]|uniref:DUF2785 domain-containing protein n=1 Tax=Streptomyces sp. HUCO-GS316 TaxID=2692198 RepID=UPI00137196AE|nr:DUF2785 domain-containing protein [Streptomyces sp. HUCO-GS316]MXM67799.1 hypothetical protein [Streptomyces sp. HUCO-GS316]